VPTYQYACRACGEELEAVQSFSDASLTECPACAGELRKVFSAVGVVFKGSGFYKNDSRKTGSSSEGPAETKKADATPAAASTDSGSSTKTDSSPAAAPAAKPAASTPAAAAS
jgi:putative FmdB family regulatory protein